jgi:hypothetical protein
MSVIELTIGGMSLNRDEIVAKIKTIQDKFTITMTSPGKNKKIAGFTVLPISTKTIGKMMRLCPKVKRLFHITLTM